MGTIQFTPIGIIHSPFQELSNMPIQPAAGKGVKGTVEIYPDYAAGLKDLDGFSHIILLYHFHKNSGYKLEVVPFLDTEKRGLFSTRAPKRPNPIGLSIVKLNRVEGATIHVENLDILDGTPLLDIKPYVGEFDRQEEIRTGWLEKARGKLQQKKSNGRFIE
jgi:tRNA-Thr(GGU) m(6)t(6)A37 methyltransferase TsaA